MPAAVGAVAGYFAGEAAIGAIGAAFGAGAIATSGSIGVLAGRAIGAVAGSVFTSALSGSPDRPQQPQSDLFNQQARGLLVNTAANDAPIPVVVGRRRVGGITSLKMLSEGNSNELNKVVVFSEGAVQEIQNFYLDDTLSTDARFSGRVSLEKALGSDTQAASPLLLANLPTAWRTTDQGKGVAYVAAELTFAQDVWNGEPVFTADVLGVAEVYDPRDAGTRFTNNPWLLIRHYMTNSRYGRGIPSAAVDDETFSAEANHADEVVTVPAHEEAFSADASTDEITFLANTIYGLGDAVTVSPAGGIPGGLAASTRYWFIPTGDAKGRLATSLANARAGVYVDITSSTGSPTPVAVHDGQVRYTCDGVIDTSRQPIDNLRDLLTACRGFLVFAGGKWKAKSDRAEAASGFAFTEDNIIGAWKIALSSKRTRYNRVRARFFNPARQWQPDFAVQESSTYRTEDNGLTLEAEVDLPYTANALRAGRIAQQEMRQSRLGTVVQFRSTIAAIRCEVGDVVTLTHTSPGFSAKLFRITDMELQSDDEVEVTAREYDDGVYSLDALSEVRTAPATSLPSPFSNLTLSGLALASGTNELFAAADGTIHSRIRASWAGASNTFLAAYEVQYARADGSPQVWQNAADVPAGETRGWVVPVDDGATYYVRVRARTTLGTTGAWLPSEAGQSHTVTGKTEAPSDVTGFAAQQASTGSVLFGVDTVADADLDTIEIRWADYGNTSWSDGQPLTNILRGKTTTTAAVPPGTWTFLAKAKDTSGNYSANAAVANLTVTSTGFTTIVATEYAPKWLGHLAGLEKHWSGVLVPSSTKLASEHTNAELFEQFVPYPVAEGTFDPYSPIDKSVDATARIWTDLVSNLRSDVTTGAAAPEAMIDWRASSGAFDGFEVWSVGTANFRYVQGRIYVDTSVGKPVITGFEITIDGEAREESGTLTVDGTGTGSVTFGTQFHNTPVLVVSPQGTGNVSAHWSGLSSTGFTGYFRTAGTLGAGTLSYSATGV